jgi:hypothetical protein
MSLVIYLEGSIPTSGTHGHTIASNTQATNTVLVTHENTTTFSSEDIPDVTVVVVVSSKQETSWDREGDGGDSAQYTIVCVDVQFPIRAQVKESARCIIRTSGKCITTWEEPISKQKKVNKGGGEKQLSKWTQTLHVTRSLSYFRIFAAICFRRFLISPCHLCA